MKNPEGKIIPLISLMYSPATPNAASWLCGLLICLTTQLAAGQSYSVLHAFSGGTDGAAPKGLVLSGTNLYGAASGGGKFGKGVIYKINKDGSGYKVLHDFSGGNDGSSPATGTHLLLISNVLYGTTEGDFQGGPGRTNLGTVFSIRTDGSGYAVIKNFHGPEGEPVDPLAAFGTTLYGTTLLGGNASAIPEYPNGGTMFKLNTDGSGFSVISGYTYGATPIDLTTLGDGLCGTTGGDGRWYGGGSVVSLSTNGSSFDLLVQFPAEFNGYGYIPEGIVIAGSNIYGMTFAGSNTISEFFIGSGTVFRLNTDGSGFSFLHCFNGTTDGALPGAGPLAIGTVIFGEHPIHCFRWTMTVTISKF